jgi:hypothetical protein
MFRRLLVPRESCLYEETGGREGFVQSNLPILTWGRTLGTFSKRSENTVLRLIPREVKSFLIGCRRKGRSDFRFSAISERQN